MKKLTFLLIALLATVACHAQKRYVTLTTVQASSPYAILSGDVPTTMKTEYYYPEVAGSIFSWTGDLLNQLADEGFKVNRMTSYVNPPTTISMSSMSCRVRLPRPHPPMP